MKRAASDVVKTEPDAKRVCLDGTEERCYLLERACEDFVHMLFRCYLSSWDSTLLSMTCKTLRAFGYTGFRRGWDVWVVRVRDLPRQGWPWPNRRPPTTTHLNLAAESEKIDNLAWLHYAAGLPLRPSTLLMAVDRGALDSVQWLLRASCPGIKDALTEAINIDVRSEITAHIYKTRRMDQIGELHECISRLPMASRVQWDSEEAQRLADEPKTLGEARRVIHDAHLDRLAMANVLVERLRAVAQELIALREFYDSPVIYE